MTRDRVGRVAGWTVAGLTGALVTVGAAMVLLFVVRHPGNLPMQTVGSIFFGIPLDLAIAVVATAILRRFPAHPIGWLFGSMAVSLSFTVLAEGFAAWVLPGLEWVLWIWSILLGPTVFALSMALLLFPNGRAQSQPLRWLARLLWLYVVAAVAVSAIVPWPRKEGFFVLWVQDRRDSWPARNPIGWQGPSWLTGIDQLVIPVGGLLMVLAVLSLVPRWLRSTSDERQQFKWLGLAAVLWALEFSVGLIVFLTVGEQKLAPLEELVGNALWTVVIVGIPVAIGVAIVRYRLYDIDVLISRTIVFGGLTVFIGLGYAVVVTYIGTFVNLWSGSAILVVLGAMAAVAVVFQPLRSGLQSGAERLVFGKRAAPYELMTRFGQEIGQTPAGSDVLVRIAEAAAQAARARFARVTATLSDGSTITATWPAIAPTQPRFHLVVPVRGDDGAIAEIAVAGGRSRSADVVLLHTVAAVSSAALRNVRLLADLSSLHETIRQQNADIAASKQRLITAADVERRQLEKVVTDRLEPHLNVLQTALPILAREAGTRPDLVVVECERLAAHATQMLHEMRDVSRGLLPPLLVDFGLTAALRALTRRLDLELDLDVAATISEARFPAPIESTVYLLCQAVLSAAADNGDAASATLRLWRENGQLGFSVTHDAALAWMDDRTALGDRIATLGGRLVTATAGERSTVTATLPLTDDTGLSSMSSRFAGRPTVE